MATDQAYRAACIELFGRLWGGLEPLLAGRDAAELLRLELYLLGDALESLRWRMLLDDAQRQGVRAALQDVRAALEKHAEATAAAMTAQNRLLEAVRFHWDAECSSIECLRATG